MDGWMSQGGKKSIFGSNVFSPNEVQNLPHIYVALMKHIVKRLNQQSTGVWNIKIKKKVQIGDTKLVMSGWLSTL